MAHIVRFGSYEADLDSGQLRKRGIRIKLRAQSFLILARLMEQPGELVTRSELQRLLWNDDVSVDFENNLNTAVAHLREVLHDSADAPTFIETLPKRGYRFIAEASRRQEPDIRNASRARLLVLPFANLSGNTALEYLGDALTDELITELAGMVPERVAVIARTTAMHYKNTRKDVSRIARELNVDYIVEGGVRQNGNRLVVNAQLIQAADQTHLCVQKQERSMRDVFLMPRKIAENIVAHLPLAGEPEARGKTGATRKPTNNLVAYGEYIQGRYHLIKATPADFVAAREHLEKAVGLDPEFGLAYDALAELNWYAGYFGTVRPRDASASGIVYALRALEIDERSGETHALLGQFHKTIGYNWSEVHREMALALELDPHSPLVRMRYAISELMPQGRIAEAIGELEHALDVDPLSQFARFWIAIMYVLDRHPERAIEESRKLLRVDPNYFLAYFTLATAYRLSGRVEDALAAHRKAAELSEDEPAVLGWMGLTLASDKRADEAREVLMRLRAMAVARYVPPTSFAWVHLGLGEFDEVFRWLDLAVDECDQFLMPIKSYAFLDTIRNDPRFPGLLEKMHLTA